MMRRLLLALCSLIVAGAQPLAADTITLKDGDKVRGLVIMQDPARVVVRTRYGEITIPKSSIASIQLERGSGESEAAGDPVWVRLADGRVLTGTLVSRDDATLVLRVGETTVTIPKSGYREWSWKPLAEHRRTAWDSVWRSAVLPGWGQFHDGQTAKGWITAGVAGGALAWTVWAGLDFLDRRKAYIDHKTHDQALYDRAEAARGRLNTLFLVTAGAWLLNVADAAVFGGTRGETRTARLAPVFDPWHGGGLVLAVSF